MFSSSFWIMVWGSEKCPFLWGTDRGLELKGIPLFLSVGITMWREKLTFQLPFECNCDEEHPLSGMFRLQGVLFPLRFFFSNLMNLPPGV